jgi:hypothetical protein
MLYGSIGNGCKGEKFTGKSRVLLDKLVYDLEASCTNVQLPQAIFVQNFATLFKCCTTILFLELKFLPREIISKNITYISKYHNIYF